MLWSKAARAAVLRGEALHAQLSGTAARRRDVARRGSSRPGGGMRDRDGDGATMVPLTQSAIIGAMDHDLTTSTARDVAEGRPSSSTRSPRSVVRAGARSEVACPVLSELYAQAIAARGGDLPRRADDDSPGEAAQGSGLRSRPLGLRARPREEHAPPGRAPARRVRDRDGAPERCLPAGRRVDRLRGDRRRRALVRGRRAVPAAGRVRDGGVPGHRVAPLRRLERLDEPYELFAIVRATNPFRGPDTVRRGLEQLVATRRPTRCGPSSS